MNLTYDYTTSIPFRCLYQVKLTRGYCPIQIPGVEIGFQLCIYFTTVAWCVHHHLLYRPPTHCMYAFMSYIFSHFALSSHTISLRTSCLSIVEKIKYYYHVTRGCTLPSKKQRIQVPVRGYGTRDRVGYITSPPKCRGYNNGLAVSGGYRRRGQCSPS